MTCSSDPDEPGDRPAEGRIFRFDPGEVFLRQLIQEKALFVEILLLVLAAALLTNFTHLFSEGQIGEVSFYVIYLLLLTMLVKAFGGRA